MSQSQDTQFALLLSRMEILEQEKIDKALQIQEAAEADGQPMPLAAILVRQGFLPYGVVERCIAHLSDTKLTCKACQMDTGAKSLDPRDPFTCPTCTKPLSLPEEDTALTALETMVEGEGITARDKGLLGRTLGGCKIESKIGEGGMGAVYEATQEFLNRKVAVKVLPEYHIHQPGFVERFLRESRSAAKIIHPNVVQVMDAGREEDLYYIIMEFVDGKSLQGILDEDGKIPVPKALEFARQSAMGLGAAAEHDIIHRDIKPDNIRVSPKGEAKVADFGLAKDVRTSTQVTMTGAVVGTPLYMSPEQARGEAVDFRGDMYALGATLYHLISGSPPFTGGSAITILQKHLEAKAQPLHEFVEGCSSEVNALVERMMAKKREDRFADYPDLVRAIEVVQGKGKGKAGRATDATMRRIKEPEATTKMAPAKAGPSKALAIVGVVAMLAVGGFFVFKALGGTGDGGSQAGGSPDAGSPDGGSPSGGTSGGIAPPAVELASFEVTSEPAGALAFLDGEEIGNTPVTLEDQQPGIRKLRLELPDYETVEVDVHFIGGRAIVESLKLVRIPALLRIVSEPESGADVYIDGEWKGKTPLDLKLATGAGIYQLKVEAAGFGTLRGGLQLKAGENPEQKITLSALPAGVEITTEPAGAKIKIDGVVVGLSPLAKTDLSAGPHVVEATLEGYLPAKTDLQLAGGSTVEHTFTLTRPEGAAAFVAKIFEAEALLKQSLYMRAFDKWTEAMGAEGIPEGVTADEQRRARRLRVEVSAGAPRYDLWIQLGEARLRGETTLPQAPGLVTEFTGAGATFDVQVKAPLQDALRFAIVQFRLGGGSSYRLLPDEGLVADEDAVPELFDEWRETYTLGRPDVFLFVMIAKRDDFSLQALDAASHAANDIGESDPVKRGRAVLESVRDWLNKSGDDFGLRAVWIDGRS